jgi:hypothetical protein
MTTQRGIAAGALLALLSLAASARGSGPGDEATAAALFQEARTLVASGDYAGALPKLVEANRLFPTIGTQLNIAICLEKVGKLASAWGAYKKAEIAARDAGDAAKQAEAARRAQALEGSLSKLTITVSPMDRFAGFEVRRDGELVGEGQLGAALPADAGEHTIEATAPGRKKWTGTVQVGPNGASASVEVPELAPETPADQGGALSWSAQRTAGVAIMAVGAAGMVTGAVFGGLALAKNAASKSDCEPADPSVCNTKGAALRADAYTFAHVSTAGLVAGSAMVVGGALLFFLAPPSAAVRASADSGHVQAFPLVSGGIAGLAVRGVW